MAIQTPNNVNDTAGNPVPEEANLSVTQSQDQQDFLAQPQFQSYSGDGYTIQQQGQNVTTLDGGRVQDQEGKSFAVARDGETLGRFAGRGNTQANFNDAAAFVRQVAGPSAVANKATDSTLRNADLRTANFTESQQFEIVTITGPAGDGSGDIVELRKDVYNVGTGELAASFWNQSATGATSELNANLNQWLVQNKIVPSTALTGGVSQTPIAGLVTSSTIQASPLVRGGLETTAPDVANPVGFLPNIVSPTINPRNNTQVTNNTGTPVPSLVTGFARNLTNTVNNTTGNPVTSTLRAVANTVRTVADNFTGTPVPVVRTPAANPLVSTIQTAFNTDPRINQSLFNDIARNLNVIGSSVSGQNAVRQFISNNGLNLTDSQFTAFRSGTALPTTSTVFNITTPVNRSTAAVTADAQVLRALNLTAPPAVTAPRTTAAAVNPAALGAVSGPTVSPRAVSSAPLQDIPGTPVDEDITDPTLINQSAQPVTDFDFGADEDIGPALDAPGAQDIPFEETGDDFLDPNDINFEADAVDEDPLAQDFADDTGDLFRDPFFDDEDLLDQTEAGYTRGLTFNAQNQVAINSQQGVQANFDWRVKLQLAPGADYLYMDPDEQGNTSGILYPLSVTNGVIFPYTPAIQTNYVANYSDYSLTHSNLRGLFYQSSHVDDISITCPFTAQDTAEANYLLAVIHFFRSVTKMFYGQDAQRGVPPPLVYLTGLGDFQFNGHPCVVSSFTYSLPADVDYIRARTSTIQGGVGLLYKRSRQDLPVNASQSSRQRLQTAGLNPGAQQPRRAAPPSLGVGTPTYVPTKMEIQLGLKPVQSRTQVSQEFSLKAYANGSLLRRGFW